MIAVTLEHLATILDANLLCSAENRTEQIDNIVIDSRKACENSLFVALKGERFDGHDFAPQAIEQGAPALLVERQLPLAVAQLIVADTRLALGRLAHWLRQQLPVKVAALTGSSGKTSVKELTALILKQCGNVLYTEGNLNNDIGVPLTLLRLQQQHQFAVIEMGANHPGEIAYSVALTEPDSALITNFSEAHLAGFGSLAGVVQAKGEIFTGLAHDGIAIINAECEDEMAWQAALTHKTLWRFSLENPTDFYATQINLTNDSTTFILHTPLGTCPILLPLLGRHNVANAVAAAALAISVGADLTAIQIGLSQAKPVIGRLYPIVLDEQRLILDDSYNANVGSMKAAIDVLSKMPGYRVLVVGDMAELGSKAKLYHQQIGDYAKQADLEAIYSVGEMAHYISASSQHGVHFANKQQLINALLILLAQHAPITLLIKGSRSSAMEQIIEGIKEKLSC